MFDFPNAPTLNQTTTAPNGAVFVWDGAKWTTAENAVMNPGGGLYLPLSGISPMTGPLTLAGNAAASLQAVPLQQLNTTVGGGYIATGSITPRSPADRAADVVHAKDFGAVFDGNSHPLSAYFTTLAAAQAVYPKATALTNEIDGIAVQAALDFCAARSGSTHEYSYGGTVVIPQALGLINTPLTINNSAVSLSSRAHGIGGRRNVTFALTSPAKLRWTGPAVTTGNAAIYMMTMRVADAGRAIGGCNLQGVLFDCNQVVGIGGILIRSVTDSLIDVGVYEPRGVPYAATLVAGSRVITVASTTNIGVGQSVVSASLPLGVYVASITNATTFNASAQATASSSETLCIGGEGMRMDVEDSIADANDTQYNEVWFTGSSEQAAAFTAGPLVMLAGSGVHGSGPGPTFHFGNTSINFFRSVRTITTHCTQLVVNNTDHNIFDFLDLYGIGGAAPHGLVLNGSLDPNNFGASRNWFNYVGGTIEANGTDTGGFTTPSQLNHIMYLDLANGGVISHIGAGCQLAVSTDAVVTLSQPYGSTQGIVPYLADSTVIGGNARGPYSVDLQTNRLTAAQVASGQTSVVSGGQNNTASGQFSTVTGGSNNTASGQSSTAIGIGNNATGNSSVALGNFNVASGVNSVAMGTSATADLYAQVALSGGAIAAGQRLAQHNVQVLQAVSAGNVTPVRLTADGAAAGSANVVNIHPASAQSGYTLSVRLVATNNTTGACISWVQPCGLLAIAGPPGTTTYTPVGTPITGVHGSGTAGYAVTEAADTTNAGYSLTFTPPTSNTQIWRVCATVEWTRVDGG